MKNIFPISKRVIVVVLLTGVLLYFVMTMLVQSRFSDLEQSTRLLIADQQTLLTAIAEITARNGADAITESIVRDCSVSERTEFDELLGSLNSGLTQSQLTTLERLFGRCGAFYTQRKSVMVSRLAREIEIYVAYVDQLSIITANDLSTAFNIEEWQTLALLEQKQSELFTNLVQVQDRIITTLLSGKSASSPEMQAILQEAREIQGAQIETNSQTAAIRAKLIAL